MFATREPGCCGYSRAFCQPDSSGFHCLRNGHKINGNQPTEHRAGFRITEKGTNHVSENAQTNEEIVQRVVSLFVSVSDLGHNTLTCVTRVTDDPQEHEEQNVSTQQAIQPKAAMNTFTVAWSSSRIQSCPATSAGQLA